MAFEKFFLAKKKNTSIACQPCHKSADIISTFLSLTQELRRTRLEVTLSAYRLNNRTGSFKGRVVLEIIVLILATCSPAMKRTQSLLLCTTRPLQGRTPQQMSDHQELQGESFSCCSGGSRESRKFQQVPGSCPEVDSAVAPPVLPRTGSRQVRVHLCTARRPSANGLVSRWTVKKQLLPTLQEQADYK